MPQVLSTRTQPEQNLSVLELKARHPSAELQLDAPPVLEPPLLAEQYEALTQSAPVPVRSRQHPDWQSALVAHRPWPEFARHWPVMSQALPEGQVPQEPPQPSSPQRLVPHVGVQVCEHTAAPARYEQLHPAEQAPHERPEQVTPQVLPEQSAMQPAHHPCMQMRPAPQAWRPPGWHVGTHEPATQS